MTYAVVFQWERIDTGALVTSEPVRVEAPNMLVARELARGRVFAVLGEVPEIQTIAEARP